jgi:two-component system, OmpR family, sensor histidine kinase KdpD
VTGSGLECNPVKPINAGWLALRLLVSVAAVGAVTLAAKLSPVNATTAGFAYLLLVLVIASTWGFFESVAASIAGTLAFNYNFLPPFGTFTIADPQNWIALFSFLATSLIASRLSTTARRRAQEAVERQKDLERLYSFSRAILLGGTAEPAMKQIANQVAEVFDLSAAVLFDRRTGEFFRGGPGDFVGLDDQLRDSALNGTTFSDPARRRIILSIRLGADPIASLALQGAAMPDSVVQGIANLIAIGLERDKAQEAASQAEAARRSEQLRTTLVDAMAHEFKTPLTSIKAVTTSLLSNPGQNPESRGEMLQIADEETDRLINLMDDAIEMGRLDTGKVRVEPELLDIRELFRKLIENSRTGIEDRSIEEEIGFESPVLGDRRMLLLALKQLFDNALKYSPAGSPIRIGATRNGGGVSLTITDRGPGISVAEREWIFDRFYRSPSVQQVPGSGLGLSIARSIARAHGGELTFESGAGQTTFRITLPQPAGGEA